MKIIYNGPFADGVVIAATGQHAAKGEAIDVDDELGARLLEQDVWTSEDEAGDVADPESDDGKKKKRGTARPDNDESVDPAPAPDGAAETAS